MQDGRYRVSAKLTDPRTGKARWMERVIEARSAKDAALVRAQCVDELARETRPLVGRVTVGDWVKRWLESKALRVDLGTAERYTTALNHALDELGDLYMDALRSTDVQGWIDRSLALPGAKPGSRLSVETARGWFRVFRTCIWDGLEPLGLQHDPTMRVAFPSGSDAAGKNALTAEELGRLLDQVRAHHKAHFAIVVTMAYTGLRFCHASALRWEDLDEEGVLHVRRKQVRGRVGPVSRVKRAPRTIPAAPALLEVLREHRQAMLCKETKGFDSGYMFPSRRGTLRGTAGMQKAFRDALERAGIVERFTMSGLRRTFNDLSRIAGVDAVVTKSMTGHVTERMREHYSTVGIGERQAAIGKVADLVSGSRDRGRDPTSESEKAGGAFGAQPA